MKLSANIALCALITIAKIQKLNADLLPYEPPSPISCSPTENCPEEYPCCSQFWTCGTGPVCVTGCNPKNSFNNLSCLRGPAFMPENFVKRKRIRKKGKKSKSGKRDKEDSDEYDDVDTESSEFTIDANLYEDIEEFADVEKNQSDDLTESIETFIDDSESVYIYADDDEIKDYFETSALTKRSEVEVEMLTESSDVKIQNTKQFHFSDLLVKHKNSDSFDNSDKVINSYAGDHMKIYGQEIIPWTEYLITSDRNDAKKQWDKVGFTYSGLIKKIFKTKEEPDSYLYLAMPKRSAGSLLTTTRSMLYGKVGVNLKTGRGRGVITTFVLFSSVHDEIDFEFLGGDLLHAQTNYYHQGELIHTRMVKAFTETSIHDEWHYYEIDWNEDRIHWLVDGRIVRTLQKVDTWDPLREIYKYPQTPMKLHVSIWPGGSETNSPGTIDWAGGLVDWEGAQDMIEKGEFDCKIQYISIEPYFNQKMADHKSIRELETKVQPNKRIGYVFEEVDEENEYLEKNVKLSNEEVMYLKNMKSTGNSPN